MSQKNTNINVRVLHAFKHTNVSVMNRKVTLDAIESIDYEMVPLRRHFARENTLTKIIGIGCIYVNVLIELLRMRIVPHRTVIIIHKVIFNELLSYFVGIPWIEKLLTRHTCTVYDTYDADYVQYPKNASILFKRTDLVICTSRQIMEKAISENPTGLAVYIPPSVDAELFNPSVKAPEKYDTEDFVIGWLGNAKVHENNLELLADKLKDLADDSITLRIVGVGAELSPKLERELECLQINCELIDWVDHAPSVIASFDVGLAPLCNTEFDRGRSEEKVREYMACGKPVIASAIGENETLISEDTGILVNTREDWTDAIYTMQNDELRERMGNCARKRIVKKYSVPVIAEQTEQMLTELVSDCYDSNAKNLD